MDQLISIGLGLAAALALVMWLRRRDATRSSTSTATAGRPDDGDLATLRQLREHGADLTKPTEVSFYLYFASRETAEKAAASAATPELSARVQESATGDGWLVLLEGTMVPTESAIRAASTRLGALASSLGGEYDGWEAKVTG
jgi:hypothetical protein